MRLTHNYLYLVVLLGFGIASHAQVSSDRNYVSSSVIRQPNITSQGAVDALSVQGKNIQVNYFDGLGRPVQGVAVQASPTGKDLVTALEYDGYGREIKKISSYLSYLVHLK